MMIICIYLGYLKHLWAFYQDSLEACLFSVNISVCLHVDVCICVSVCDSS